MAVEVISSTGLFGAIWGLISGGAIIKDSIQGAIKDSKSKDRAYEEINKGKNEARVYYDHKGLMRSLDTNEIVSYRFDSNTHDLLLVDVYGKILRNLSEEYRQAQIKYAEENYDELHSCVMIKSKDLTYSWKYECQWNDFVYKDIMTGRLYVVREFKKEINIISKKIEKDEYFNELFSDDYGKNLNNIAYYMDMETGLLVRPADSYLRRYEKICKKALQDRANKHNQEVWDAVQKEFNYVMEFIDKFNKFQEERRSQTDFSDWLEYSGFYLNRKGPDYDTETEHRQ